MGMLQPLAYGASKEEWDAWMAALTNWGNNMDGNTAGLPVTKQGIDNIMQTSASTSNAFLMYYVTTLPPKPSYSNQVVYNGQDGRIYAWNSTTSSWEATGATAFDELTGFLQAGQLLLGNQLNICTNGCFTNDTVGQAPNGWSTTSTYSNAPVVVQPGGSTPAGCPTANCIQLSGRDTYFTAANGFDVKPGENYYLEGYMGSDGSTPGMQIGLYFPAVGANGPLWTPAVQAASGLNGWITKNGVVIVPTWANRAQVWLQVNSFGPAWGNNWFTGIECVKAPSTVQIYGAINNVPLNGTNETTILNGSFKTGYTTIINAEGNVGYASVSDVNFDIRIYVDGALAADRYVDFTLGGQPYAFPLDLFCVVNSAGSHTFSLTVQQHTAGATAATYTLERMTVLNLLK